MADGSTFDAIPGDLRPGGAFEQFVAEQAAQDRFSGAVMLAYRDQPVLTLAYGMANEQLSMPNGIDTIFSLASVTKCFTSVAIAQLVQQGEVSFQQTLGSYLDGFPAEVANAVTVHQLLSHTSGLGRPVLGTGTAPGSAEWKSLDEELEGTLAMLRQTPLRFTPGDQFGYSNDGFVVLGAIVARVAGQSYFDYVRQHIFAPAGLNRTDFYTMQQVQTNDDIARPYMTPRSGGDRVDASATLFSGGPGSAIYASPSDLLRFASALRAGTLLDPVLTELLTSAKFGLPPSVGPYPSSQGRFAGYGYFISSVNDRRIFGHPGNGPGRATNLDIFPEVDWASVVVSNFDNPVDAIVDRGRELITQARS